MFRTYHYQICFTTELYFDKYRAISIENYSTPHTTLSAKTWKHIVRKARQLSCYRQEQINVYIERAERASHFHEFVAAYFTERSDKWSFDSWTRQNPYNPRQYDQYMITRRHLDAEMMNITRW